MYLNTAKMYLNTVSRYSESNVFIDTFLEVKRTVKLCIDVLAKSL